MQFEQLGPYRLGKKLGQGGMGAVYAGVDVDTGDTAAIKVLSPTLAVDEGFRVRFEAEIDSLKKLRHPNIVRLYGYGEQAGTLFYAMELVDGTSLEDVLRTGRRFEWREVTQIGIKLCKALKHAHDHGVIHRDLKPANLLMDGEGEVKLSDFGIARLFGNTRMTSDGGVLGTAEYMAPEQADGRPVTDRCDQYSLGGVLYALLAGRPPFRAKSLLEMLQLQRFADPDPVTRYAPHTPAELARIIHQLLEKEPQKRFANTLMLSRSLEAMERGLSISMSRDDDFVLGDPTGGPYDAARAAMPTLTPTQWATPENRESQRPVDLSATEATLAYAANKPQVARDDDEENETLLGTSFVKVDEQRDASASGWADMLANVLSVQTISLVTALILLLVAAWYLMRAPDADTLYRQIEAATADGDATRVRAALPQIDRFLANYPEDPRSEQLRGWKEETTAPNPVRQLYSEAMRYSLINPELAIGKLQALVDVYGDDEENPEATRRFVRLARQNVKRLQERVAQYESDGRRLIESRLEKARELAAAGNADAAAKIYRGIVELYADKSWAAELVEQARAGAAADQPAQAAVGQP